MKLKDMNCVVTGATGGTGPAIVELLSQKCAAVVGVARGENGRWSNLGGSRFQINANILDPKSVERLVSEVVKHFKSIHVWINVVGGFAMGKNVEDTKSEDWRGMHDLNFNSVLNCCRQILPIFKAQHFGRIINFGSVAGLEGMGLAGPYAMSKAAVINLTKTVALEGKDYEITANVIIPSIIDTPANRRAMPEADFSKWTTPIQIAEKIVMLIGSVRTGETVRV